MSARSPDVADLAYGSESAAQTLDLYLPDRSHPPLVIQIHGGGWLMGDKRGYDSEGPPGLAAFLDAGLAVAAINYRLTGEAIWPAQRDDVLRAIAYLRAEGERLGIDTSRIAVFGDSAGGHLAMAATIALAGAGQTGLSAAAIWFPPVDLLTIESDMDASGVPRGEPKPSDADSPNARLIGAPVRDAPELARAAGLLEPLAGLPDDAVLPPILVMHGGRDPMVATRQSRRLVTAIADHPACGSVLFEVIPDAGHGDAAFLAAGAVPGTVAFLARAFGCSA